MRAGAARHAGGAHVECVLPVALCSGRVCRHPGLALECPGIPPAGSLGREGTDPVLGLARLSLHVSATFLSFFRTTTPQLSQKFRKSFRPRATHQQQHSARLFTTKPPPHIRISLLLLSSHRAQHTNTPLDSSPRNHRPSVHDLERLARVVAALARTECS